MGDVDTGNKATGLQQTSCDHEWTLHLCLFANVKQTFVKRRQNNIEITLSTYLTIYPIFSQISTLEQLPLSAGIDGNCLSKIFLSPGNFMIENTQSGTEDGARSGTCLYAPSKDKDAVLRLTACNENDEKQMFSYNLKGLLVVSN